jgi:hypothetical protein
MDQGLGDILSAIFLKVVAPPLTAIALALVSVVLAYVRKRLHFQWFKAIDEKIEREVATLMLSEENKAAAVLKAKGDKYKVPGGVKWDNMFKALVAAYPEQSKEKLTTIANAVMISIPGIGPKDLVARPEVTNVSGNAEQPGGKAPGSLQQDAGRSDPGPDRSAPRTDSKAAHGTTGVDIQGDAPDDSFRLRDQKIAPSLLILAGILGLLLGIFSPARADECEAAKHYWVICSTRWEGAALYALVSSADCNTRSPIDLFNSARHNGGVYGHSLDDLRKSRDAYNEAAYKECQEAYVRGRELEEAGKTVWTEVK